MTTDKRMNKDVNHEEKWLEQALEQLNLLCREAIKYADEDDVLPSSLAQAATGQILKSFEHAFRPKMGLTVNGEISLLWNNTGDEFRAYVKQDGSVQYFKKETLVDEPTFSKYLTAVPA